MLNFFDLLFETKTESTIEMARFPLKRITAIAPIPGGVAIATMVVSVFIFKMFMLAKLSLLLILP